MADHLSSFADIDQQQHIHNGIFILKDFLVLPIGSMPAQLHPRNEDTTVCLMEDAQGVKMQFNLYGTAINNLAGIPRDTVVILTDFTVSNVGVPPLYRSAIQLKGYIDATGSVTQRGQGTERVYSLEEVETYLGRFVLQLVRVDPVIEPTSVGRLINTHWFTSDGSEVMLTAYREEIERLEGYHLEINSIYLICNAVPWPNSIYATTHFTLGPATAIEEIDI